MAPAHVDKVVSTTSASSCAGRRPAGAPVTSTKSPSYTTSWDVTSRCARPLAAGTTAAWDAVERRTYCLSCETDPNPPTDPRPPTPTAAVEVTLAQLVSGGVSAQREYDKRSARRKQQVRQQHPRLGGLLLALSNEPTSTRVWAQGAAGERAVAAELDALVGGHVVALHDRRLRRLDGTLSKANINHIAVTPSGVWVIDAKTHQGSLAVRRSGGLFSPRVEALYINGRDQTRLVHGLLKQVDAVRRELSTVEASIAAHGALCFVGTELPWFGSSSIADVPLLGRRGLAKLLLRPGDVDTSDRAAVAAFLDQRFPPAKACEPCHPPISKVAQRVTDRQARLSRNQWMCATEMLDPLRG